ncbi:MAG: hypothetical protein JO140_04635 [Candidatus Eremiobacteraeota bacterium]|nr:hypothetical protein [Candidatus Eremiobacteraeota bacterium]
MSAELVLAPEVEARAALAGRELSERLLLPPYPALGVGRLRVVRVRAEEGSERLELLCSYEGYEPL